MVFCHAGLISLETRVPARGLSKAPTASPSFFCQQPNIVVSEKFYSYFGELTN